MKRSILFLTAAMVLMGFFSALQAGPRSEQKMNLKLWGGGITSVRGDFAPGLKTDEVVKDGQSFGLAWQYFPLRSLGIQAGYELGWMRFDKSHRLEPDKSPAFAIHQITLAGVYNFANLADSRARIRPYLSAGAGIYPFRFTEDGITGKAQTLPNGKKFAKTSFGLNGGAGIEVLPMNRLSINGGARYHYLFAKDNDKFGTDSNFGDQANLSVGIGLSYRLASRY
jgi:opacity protein-like surface antigen